MENKPQDYHKTEKIDARVTPQEKTLFEEIGREFGTKTNTETLKRLMQERQEYRKSQGSQALGQTQAIMPQEIQEICERCKKKGCPAYPRFDAEAQEMLCVFTSEGKEPKILHRSLVEFEACSDSPILVSMARKRELEQKFETEKETWIAQIDRAEENATYEKDISEKLIERDNENVREHSKDTTEIRRLADILEGRRKRIEQLERNLQPMQTYITKIGKVSNWRLHTANFLLRVMNERDTLEMENEELTKQVGELSQDRLAEKCASLTVQLSKSGEEIIGLKTQVGNLEDASETRERKTTELISETRKMLTEFKQFLPSNLIQCQQCVDGTTMREYLRNIRKQINDFEGYLKTTMPTPKDNLERYT